MIILVLWAALLAAVPAALAAQDAFETWAGLDYDRHLWMKADPCREELLLETAPGLRRAGGPCVAMNAGQRADTETFAASLAFRYRDLLGRADDEVRFAHDETTTFLDVSLRKFPALELRSVWERGDDARDFRDSSIGISTHSGNPAWNVRNSLRYSPVPWFVPVIAFGAGSHGQSEVALGATGTVAGFYGALLSGRKSGTLPADLRLEDYRPFTFPLMLRQEFHALTSGWTGDHLGLSWTTRLRRDRHPDEFDALYSVSDSGQSVEHVGGVSWTDSLHGRPSRLSLEGEYFSGARVFRGVRAREGALYQFAYEETRQRNAWLRADATTRGKRWQGGLFAGWSGARWDALRPEVASGRYFWDRNGVLDSYQGGILDLFSRETWLFDGSMGLSQKAAGAWLALPAGAWRCRLGASYHFLEMEAYGHLTKKTSTFIIAYTERDYFLNFYGVDAHFLTPELNLSRRYGRAFVEASAAQAIPLAVNLRGESGSGEGGGKVSSASAYSGGTDLRLRVGWGLPSW